jgi:hypothetical protein
MTDEERDAHLRAALRHAPDADLQPPPALSALILKEAQAKARNASAPSRAPRQTLLRVWDWLARPSVATGFAGVMVATLVGLMWWDQPMDEALPRAPVPAAAPAAQQAPTASPTPAVTAPQADAELAQPQATLRRAVEADKAAARERKKEAPAPVATKPTSPAERRADTAPQAREEVATAPAAAAMPPPAPGVASTDNTQAGVADQPAKSRPVDETRRLRAVAPAAEATSSQGGAPAKLDALRQSPAAAAPTLAQLRRAIAAEPARWAWQRDGGAPQALNDAVRNWLARLDADAGERWQPVEASALRPGREIRLLQDSHMQHGFRLIEGAVLWQRPQGSWQQVALPPMSLSALEASAP